MKPSEMVEYIRDNLNTPDLNLMDLSRRSGVSYTALREIKAGDGNPTVSTLTAIYDALAERANR